MKTNLGNNIIQLRKEKGLSQSQLAELSGLTKRQIGYYEQESSEPFLTNVSAIANALGVDIVELLFSKKSNDLQATLKNVDARTIRKIKQILDLPKKELHIIYAVVDGLIAKLEKEKNT